MTEDPSALETFDGNVRLFPLPDLVLFPHVTQALHIFESRYRQMTADALAGDRLIAMVLLRPGWESDYEGRPALADVACLGRIIADERLEDGRYLLQLHGLARARIMEELDAGTLYRMARVELVPTQDELFGPDEQSLRRQLLDVVPNWCLSSAESRTILIRLIASPTPLAAISDIITYALPLALDFKQQQLETPEVARRVHALLRYLRTNAAAVPSEAKESRFPPGFSTN